MAKTRIQFLTGKTTEWIDSFIPYPGELCIFSDYENTGKINHLGNKIYSSNIKIGTGNTSLAKLSYLRNEAISANQIKSLFGIIEESETTSVLGTAKLGYALLGT